MDPASMRKLLILFATACVQAAWVPQVDACCLTDWLFHRRRTQTPTVAYYGAAPAPVAATAAAPTAAAAPCSSCGPGYCEETVVRYVPEVAYRTVWQPVPVTTYKRTVNYNPSTGLPITCTQPCTTYTYQARRVPYTTFRPVYTQVPVSSPATPVTTTPISTVPVAAPSSCNTCSPSMAPSYTPYQGGSSAAPYSPPTAPTTADPPGATPWEPVAPTPSAPSSSDWSTPYSSPSSSDPADQRPRIDPDAGNSFSSLRLPSTPAPYNTWNRVNPYGSNGEAYEPSSSRSATPNSNSWTSADESGWSSEASDSRNSSSPVSPVAPFELRPLPNYDRQSETADPSAPSPFDSNRDRTAMVRPIPTRWSATPIAWPERTAQHTAERTVSEKTPVRQLNYRRLEPERVQNPQHRFDSDSQTSSWDQSGWRSSNR
jgi:hypothetical protein